MLLRGFTSVRDLGGPMLVDRPAIGRGSLLGETVRRENAWGTDFLFMPAQNVKQNADIVNLKQCLTPAEALKLVTLDNAQLLALSAFPIPISESSASWFPVTWLI